MKILNKNGASDAPATPLLLYFLPLLLYFSLVPHVVGFMIIIHRIKYGLFLLINKVNFKIRFTFIFYMV